MRKLTVNQMKWQAILAQTQKALAEITKRTGLIFDEAELRPKRPKRITEKKLTQLKQTELDFIHKQVEDVVKNMRTHEVEELMHKVRTKEEYIRHPRISKGKQKREPYPLTYAERSERAKKAWATRWSRMTPEEQVEYGKSFAARMRKAREAKELERKGFVPLSEKEEAPAEKDWVEVLGEPLTPEEVQELDYAKQTQENYMPKLTNIIDYSVENSLFAMLDDPDVIPERISELVNTLNEYKNKLGDVKYYQLLEQNASDILDYSLFWLTYHHEGRARALGLNPLMRILHEGALDLIEALKNSTQYDTEMLDIE